MKYPPCQRYKSGSLRQLLVTALAVCCLGSRLQAFAADIRVDPSSATGNTAVLEGRIEVGDSEKLRDFVITGNDARQIYLASPGGNLAEAMKLGLFIRALNLSTIVPSKTLTREEMVLAAKNHDIQNIRSDYMCASACFLVFVAGIRRASDHHGSPILGIHRPTITGRDGIALTIEERSTAEAQVRRLIENYLKLMDVPPDYIEDMYSTPHGTVRWIRNDEFEHYFDGFVPELKEIIGTACAPHLDRPKTTANNQDVEHAPNLGPQASDDKREQCEERFQMQLANSAHDRAAVKGPIAFPSPISKDLRALPAE